MAKHLPLFKPFSYTHVSDEYVETFIISTELPYPYVYQLFDMADKEACADDIADAFVNDAHFIFIYSESRQKLVAYLTYYRVDGHLNITDVYVTPSQRNIGLGSVLMRTLLGFALYQAEYLELLLPTEQRKLAKSFLNKTRGRMEKQVKFIYLLVDSGNKYARKLYHNFGFCDEAAIPDYYGPGENATQMMLTVE